jgi:uncharacterized protein (DUF927 family)
LPGGRLEGPEYVVRVRPEDTDPSFKINLRSGAWADFGSDAKGGDPVSLFACLRNLSQGDAARALAEDLGMDPGGNGERPTAKPAKADPWTPVLPVPDDAPAPDLRHPRLGLPAATWEYQDRDGKTLGHVCRFDPDGRRKEILPLAFCRGPEGKTEWRWKAFPEPRPLYGLHRLAAAPAGSPLLLVEGEKAADAAGRLLGSKVVCLTWPGGSKAVGKADFAPLKGRRVFLWPDNDRPGVEAMLAVARKVEDAGASEVSIVPPPPCTPEGWDLADAEHLTGRDAAAFIRQRRVKPEQFREIARARFGLGAEAPAEKTTPASASSGPFSIRPDGVYFLAEDKDGGVNPEWLCSPLEVRAATRNADGEDWGRLLWLKDREGREHLWAMPMSLTAGSGDEYRAQLLSLGLDMAPGKRAKERLGLYLSTARAEAFARCVARIGWHGRRFVLPDAVCGEDQGETILLQGQAGENLFRQSGTLDEWQERIGRKCIGNSRLALAVSAALAAPLLHPGEQESGGFHLVGPSSVGKTTALQVAGSVCGGGGIRGYVRQWRATDNALESVAAVHCDTLLCLDEMSQIPGKAAGEVAYMLANGAGKARAKRDGLARKPQEWRVLFLSTGEITLADKVREDGRTRATAGQSVRVVDVPADAGAGLGLFENLHGAEDGDRFARGLKESAARCHGTALRAFLEALTRRLDDVAREVPASIRAFVETRCPADADGQVKRVAARFGLVAAAGELGVSLGVLPWPEGEATRAAGVCFEAWLEQRGGTGAAEVQTAVEQVRNFIEAHGASRFQDWNGSGETKVVNRVGFRRKNDADEWEHYFLPGMFQDEVCRGLNGRQVVRELVALGLILPGPDGKPGHSLKVPGEGKMRLYHFGREIHSLPENRVPRVPRVPNSENQAITMVPGGAAGEPNGEPSPVPRVPSPGDEPGGTLEGTRGTQAEKVGFPATAQGKSNEIGMLSDRGTREPREPEKPVNPEKSGERLPHRVTI